VTGRENILTGHIDAVSASIARHVRDLRQARGWSLDELAYRSGVSKGMVVQIEGARTNPSIGTLCRVAEAFGVNVGRLVEAPPERVVRVIRADEPPVLWRGAGGGRGRLLRGLAEPANVELWQWELAPGDGHSSDQHQPGTRELTHVHAGELTVVVDGERHRVVAGETIDYPADHPHEYHNEGSTPTNLTMIVVMP
jgi:transcriptional regulator with XRE-family HTH domain